LPDGADELIWIDTIWYAWLHRREFNSKKGSLDAWLRRIARNLLADFARTPSLQVRPSLNSQIPSSSVGAGTLHT
jgi:DNA-directed RNA polymerase specialized sigma24 family protein